MSHRKIVLLGPDSRRDVVDQGFGPVGALDLSIRSRDDLVEGPCVLSRTAIIFCLSLSYICRKALHSIAIIAVGGGHSEVKSRETFFTFCVALTTLVSRRRLASHVEDLATADDVAVWAQPLQGAHYLHFCFYSG